MSTEEIRNMYNTEFYKAHRDDSFRSAEVIVPLILNVFPVDSVVDIGCGVGTWLSAFRACGVNSISGFDVNDLPVEDYFVDKNCIETRCDFSSKDFLLNIKSDLGICLEVGEHLPDEAAGDLVANLVNMSPVIVFSAAFPGQSGLNHVNEQPPWYWRDKFHANGYMEIDFLRPLIWSDARVCWWYRQNITSFVHPDYLNENISAAAEVTMPKGQAPPFGSILHGGSAILDVGAGWFHDVSCMGYICRDFPIYEYMNHSAGHPSMFDGDLYARNELNALETLKIEYGRTDNGYIE